MRSRLTLAQFLCISIGFSASWRTMLGLAKSGTSTGRCASDFCFSKPSSAPSTTAACTLQRAFLPRPPLSAYFLLVHA